MFNFIYRLIKNSPLTWAELDGNFRQIAENAVTNENLQDAIDGEAQARQELGVRVDRSILSYPTYAAALNAARTLPDDQEVVARDVNELYKVASESLVFVSALYIKNPPIINSQSALQYSIRNQLIRTSATGGFNSVIQGAEFEHAEEKIITVSGGGTDGRGHSLNIFSAGFLGPLSTYVWNRSIKFGHQGIGLYTSKEGEKVAWLSRNYNDTPSTGNLITSFTGWKAVNTDSITDGIIEWKVFPTTTSPQSTTPTVSSDGRYLIAKFGAAAEIKVRVFDVQKMWDNRLTKTDYSTDFLYEFTYKRPYETDGITTFMQGFACDGQYIYALEQKPGLADDCKGWVYIFLIDGTFVSRVDVTNVGKDIAIANSPNPASKDGLFEMEGINIIRGQGNNLRLNLSFCTSWVENGAQAKRAYMAEIGASSVSYQFKSGINSSIPGSTPSTGGDISFELTSNTQMKIKVRGTDGVARSANITLA